MQQVTYSDAQLPGFEMGSNDAPALIVLQEFWGVTDVVKEEARQLSEATGFRAFIPDLYHGKVGVEVEEAMHLSSHLDWSKAKDELVAAVEYLKATGSPKVGVIGFCMGGALAFMAAQFADVAAVAPFYGTPRSREHCQVEAIKVPVQMHFGALDEHSGFSDPATARATADKIKAAGGTVELFIYEHSGHGFLNSLTGDMARDRMEKIGHPPSPVEEAQLAFDRVVTFFKQHLSA